MCWSRCTASNCPACCRSRRTCCIRCRPTTWRRFLIEVELLLDWYLPRLGAPVTDDMRAELRRAVARALLPVAIEAPPTWVLRDYHSPNLIWLPERQGMARVGLLDFQDAVMGPAAYDVASLLQDARVDVPELMEISLLGRYVAQRGRGRSGLRRAGIRRGSTRRWRRSAPRKFSASSRGSTGATASRNICVTCRAYGAICSARWRIPRWRRCRTGTDNVPTP